MLNLPRHNRAGNALGLKSLDELRQLPQRNPVNGSGAARRNLSESLFLDGRDHHLIPLSPSRIQHKKRKRAIAGDEPKFHSRWSVVGGQWSVFARL